MRLYFLTFIILILLGGCHQIAENVETSFIEANNELMDSIKVVELQNQMLFDAINSDRIKKWQGENSATVFYSIGDHNKLIDSIATLIITNSTAISDRLISEKLMIQDELAERIQNSSAKTKIVIKIWTRNVQLPEAELNRILPGHQGIYAGENWAGRMFDQLPTYAAIPILNKWKLENLKSCNSLLVYLRNDIANEKHK